MTDVLSEPPNITGMNACTDAALMQAAGTPAPLIGATGGNYHAPGEWLSVPDFMKLCAILQATGRGRYAVRGQVVRDPSHYESSVLSHDYAPATARRAELFNLQLWMEMASGSRCLSRYACSYCIRRYESFFPVPTPLWKSLAFTAGCCDYWHSPAATAFPATSSPQSSGTAAPTASRR